MVARRLQSAMRVTPEEYLERERRAEFRSEYREGIIVAMAGATEAHNTINSNLIGILYNALRGGSCRAYANDMRVQIGENRRRYVYPDTVVVCGERRFDSEHRDNLLNPTMILEILSESTEGYDRGEKFLRYQAIESLQEYVLVSQSRPVVERFRRDGDHWNYAMVEGLTAIARLESLGVELALSDVYEGVEFPPEVSALEE